MSQVQGASNAYYSMPWLYQSTQQSGPAATSADSFFGATDSTAQSSDPFSAAFAASTPTSGSPGATQPFSLGAMSALIAAQAQQSGTTTPDPLSPQQQKVFSELDTNGDGTVTKSELEADFGTNNKQLADAVFSKLDTNNDGSISASEFGAGTTKTAHHGHHHHMQASSADPSSSSDPTPSQDPLAALLNTTPGTSTQSVDNSDGSTTTTVTYADGSKVSTTSAPAATNSDNSTDSNSTQGNPTTQNLLEQLIQLQSQLTMASISTATTALTI